MKADFFSAVLEASLSLDSLYEGTLKDRRALVLFLDQNGLLDQTGFPMDTREDIIRLRSPWYPEPEARKNLLARLDLWLRAYKRSDRHRLSILLAYGRDFLPRTCHTYEEFTASVKDGNPKVSWQLLDYLLSVLDREVPDMDLTRTEELLSAMKVDLPVRHLALFTSYLTFLNSKALWHGAATAVMKPIPFPNSQPWPISSLMNGTGKNTISWKKRAIPDSRQTSGLSCPFSSYAGCGGPMW